MTAPTDAGAGFAPRRSSAITAAPRNDASLTPEVVRGRPSASAFTLQRRSEPGVEIAAVRQRASFDDTLVVDPMQEERRPGLRSRGLVDRSKRARGSDHQRRALTAQGARAEVGARAVEECRVPA